MACPRCGEERFYNIIWRDDKGELVQAKMKGCPTKEDGSCYTKKELDEMMEKP